MFHFVGTILNTFGKRLKHEWAMASLWSHFGQINSKHVNDSPHHFNSIVFLAEKKAVPTIIAAICNDARIQKVFTLKWKRTVLRLVCGAASEIVGMSNLYSHRVSTHRDVKLSTWTGWHGVKQCGLDFSFCIRLYFLGDICLWVCTFYDFST